MSTSGEVCSVLSVQGRPYLSDQVVQVYPSKPISLVATVYDAFGHKCKQEPPLGINLSPQPALKFVGSLQGRLDRSGIVHFTQASRIQLLQGSSNQHFNLNIGSTNVATSNVQMSVVRCPAG